MQDAVSLFSLYNLLRQQPPVRLVGQRVRLNKGFRLLLRRSAVWRAAL